MSGFIVRMTGDGDDGETRGMAGGIDDGETSRMVDGGGDVLEIDVEVESDDERADGSVSDGESDDDNGYEIIDLPGDDDEELNDNDDVVDGCNGTGQWTEITGGSKVQVNDFAPGGSPPGVNHQLGPNATALDYFHLFFDQTFLTELVNQTNLYARVVRALALANGKQHRTV